LVIIATGTSILFPHRQEYGGAYGTKWQGSSVVFGHWHEIADANYLPRPLDSAHVGLSSTFPSRSKATWESLDIKPNGDGIVHFWEGFHLPAT
jgi:hypothetical protein